MATKTLMRELFRTVWNRLRIRIPWSFRHRSMLVTFALLPFAWDGVVWFVDAWKKFLIS